MSIKINSEKIVFDSDKAFFGFKRLIQLHPVDDEEQIKGYPCLAYNKHSDVVKLGMKVIPLEKKYDLENHPCLVEIKLLKEFTSLIIKEITPHITFYFTDIVVYNKKKALTQFPLKGNRNYIHKNSRVLIAEYVPGGSIEEWIHEQPNISEKQWKYIIFSVAWTLLVLHDQYQFMHNDFHYGNILIDTSISPTDKSYIKYILKTTDREKPYHFNVQNCGILPKCWDAEFSRTFAENFKCENILFKEVTENIPNYFTPYYDLHYFLTSLLELDCLPEKIRDFILSHYPAEVLPPIKNKEYYNTDSDISSGSNSSISRTSINIDDTNRYYETDEESTNTYETESNSSSDEENDKTSSSVNSNSEYSGSGYSGSDESECTSRSSNSNRSSSTCSCSSCNSVKNLRTDYMLGDRLLNGTEDKIKLPKPIDIICHEYFSDYRNPLGNSKKVNCTFSYELKK